MRDGRRGLHRDHPAQVNLPPKKPAKDAAPETAGAWEQAHHAESSTRICGSSKLTGIGLRPGDIA
jgi:hypothetical protein